MMRTFLAATSLTILSLGYAQAITLGQVDDFQDGTTQGWVEGLVSPNLPMNLRDGGPDGVGDHALRNVSSGLPIFGGRLIQFNQDQWTGDYLTAGVDRLDVMLRADPSSTSPLEMRIALEGDAFQRFASAASFPLPNDGNWHAASFLLADMVQISGTHTLAQVLSNVSELRVLHNSVPAWRGDVIAATLDMDNLTSAQVPEPNSLALLLVGTGFLMRFRV